MQVSNERAEWQAWQEDFHAAAEPASASELRRHVIRHGSFQRAIFWGEIALVAATVVLPGWWLAVAPEPWKWAWAATMWAFAALAMAYGAWNRRGTWEPVDDSLAAQLDLTELRGRRRLRTLALVPLQFLAESAAVLGLFAWFHPQSLPWAAQLLAAGGVVLALWAVPTFVRTRRRLAEVRAMRRELAEELPWTTSVPLSSRNSEEPPKPTVR
jgi:hypothetical protein